MGRKGKDLKTEIRIEIWVESPSKSEVNSISEKSNWV